MIVKTLKDKDKIIKELIDAESSRTGYFIYPESRVEENFVSSIMSILRDNFDSRHQVLYSLAAIEAAAKTAKSRVKAGDSSILSPNGFNVPSDTDNAS